ncbi:MAG: hypothetical protein WKF96_00335 [Solirubrobacteraceae bacterium]
MSGLDALAPVRAAAVRTIRAGHDLHHSASEDPDLALLDGDRLYAEGLAALASDGDLDAVRVMAEIIAVSAAALGHGDRAAAERAWEQGLRDLAR